MADAEDVDKESGSVTTLWGGRGGSFGLVIESGVGTKYGYSYGRVRGTGPRSRFLSRLLSYDALRSMELSDIIVWLVETYHGDGGGQLGIYAEDSFPERMCVCVRERMTPGHS